MSNRRALKDDTSKYTAILCFACFVFLCFLSKKHRLGTYGVKTDFYRFYVPDAIRIISAKVPTDSFKGQGYPVIIALLNVIIGDFFVSGKLLSIISATFFLFFTYKLFQDIFSSKLALSTIVFLTINPLFIKYSITASTDMFFAALIAIFFYSSISSKNKTWGNIASGISIGYASITRYNALILPIIYLNIYYLLILKLKI